MEKHLEKNIWKYYIINIFSKLMIVPILVVFFLSKGLSATEIGLILSIGTIAALLFEVPSGYISDSIGHKKAIAISFFIKFISALFYAFGNSFWPFLLGVIIYDIGNSLWTGTGSSFLFETLKDLDRKDDYEKISGKSITISQPIGALFLIITPFIYAFNAPLAFLVNSALLLFAFFVSLSLAQPSFIKHVGKEEGFAKLFTDSRRIFGYIRSRKRYSTLMLFTAAWHGIQDAIDEFQQIFLQFLQVPTQLFGFVYGANRVMQGAGAYFAHKAKRFFNQLRFLSFLGVSLTVFFFVVSLVKTAFGAVIFPLRNFIEGFATPLESSYLNHEITDGDRVSLLSVGNLFAGILKAVFTFLIGILFDIFTVPTVFVILGVGTAVIMLALYIPARIAYRN